MNDRMFDTTSFDELGCKTECQSAVSYFAHNETKFRQELEIEGLSYEEVQKEIRTIWKSILRKCAKYGYSDYITALKRRIYDFKK